MEERRDRETRPAAGAAGNSLEGRGPWLIAAVSLAPLLLILSLVYGLRHDTDEPSPEEWPDIAREQPLEAPALAARSDGGLELLLKPRFGDPERARFLDRALTQRLGVEGEGWRVFELWLANRSAKPIERLPYPLELRGGQLPGGSLLLQAPSDLRSGDAGVQPLIGAFAVDPNRALAPGALRRWWLLAPPVRGEALSLKALDGARLGAIELTPGVLVRALLEQALVGPGVPLNIVERAFRPR